MNYRIVAHFLSILSFTITTSFIFPLFWAVVDGTNDVRAILLSAAAGAAISVVLFTAGRGAKRTSLVHVKQ